MAKYIERLKEKVKIKKFDSNQPIGAWIFVVILNIVGFAGYFYLKVFFFHFFFSCFIKTLSVLF